MASLSLQKIIDKMKLENLTPEVDITKVKVSQPDINRPALQLAGYFQHFEKSRLQIIGFVEYSYMISLSDERKREIYSELLSGDIPGIVFCRELKPDPIFKEIAIQNNVPLLMTRKATSTFMAEIIRWMNVKLAPCISIHGVLVDIYGEGVLITGESGIGKSEAALELVKRGHRLIADDVVEIRKVSEETLIGSAPDITKHLIEVRGIGIIDVRRLFGMGAVKQTEKIDLVINLEPWQQGKMYDRLGLDNETMDILGIKIPSITIPVKPGRNLAIILEIAAMNNRQKRMGYNSAQELLHRLGMDGSSPATEEEKNIWSSF